MSAFLSSCWAIIGDMGHLRKYGDEPFTIAVVHGGPGAAGEMASVARELSLNYGVLEPLQTCLTIKEQLQELEAVLSGNGSTPVTLIGHSWGAILSFIFAADNPESVSKLILIDSAVFEEKYAAHIMKTRLNRLTPDERLKIEILQNILDDPNGKNKDEAFAGLGELLSKADSFNPLPHKNEVVEYRYDIYASVWGEFEKLRRSGDLLAFGELIRCPVTVIHGDYDPHPFEGVKAPLSRVIKDIKFYLLHDCGHYPWIEAGSKENFFEILKKETE